MFWIIHDAFPSSRSCLPRRPESSSVGTLGWKISIAVACGFVYHESVSNRVFRVLLWQLGGFLGKNVEQEFGTFSKGEANGGTLVEHVCLAKR